MIPRVRMHQTSSVMMGDRIVKYELNSQGELTNIDEHKWDFYVYIPKSHKMNCEMKFCIENACYDMVNDLYIESMRK